MFKSFNAPAVEGYLEEKNPLTKSFDLLNNYLVLPMIVSVRFDVLDIILLYKTILSKKDV